MDPSEDRLTEAERLARENVRQDQHVLDGVARRGGVKTARDRWVVDSRRNEPRPVEVLPTEAYSLPSHARKILSPSTLTEIEAILADVRTANDEMLGVDVSVANLLLSDDELVLDVRARLRRWAQSYVSERLAKRSPRDAGDTVLRFKRIYYELLPSLEEIATREAGAHFVFMGEFIDYVAWLIFQGTWAHMLESDVTGSHLHGQFRLTAPPEHGNFCMELVRLYAWPSADDVLRAVRAIHRRGPLQPVRGAAARERLAALAAEIREVRPFVIGGHNPEKCSADVAPGLVASWFWGGSQQLGIVPLHDDPRRRVTEFRSRSFATTLRVRHDGVLASEFAPWINVDTILEAEPDALAANLAFVEAIHGRLLEVFAKVDLNAAYGRVRDAAAGSAGDAAPTQEAVAATFVVAEPDVAQETPSPSLARPRVRVPSLRLERFLAILERLGCEVRQGKGSEVVAYRPGGRIARIGRHTRNREVPSTLVQRVLHQVGVTLAEWVGAVG